MAKLELDVTSPLTLGELLNAAIVNGEETVVRWQTLLALFERRIPGASREEILALTMPDVARLLKEFVAKVLNPGVQLMLEDRGQGH